MKNNHAIAEWLMLLALSTLNLQPSTAYAQGTACTYQGQLNDRGGPANGVYDLRFQVWDALTNGNLVAGPLTALATGITNGLFAVILDFGPGVFTGPGRWLELDVRTNGNGAFTTLLPLQQILPMPYSVMANAASNLLGMLPAEQLSGTLPSSALAGYSRSSGLHQPSRQLLRFVFRPLPRRWRRFDKPERNQSPVHLGTATQPWTADIR